MTPSIDLLLVDPSGGADRPVTVPREARFDRLADRLAGHVQENPGTGWSLRRAGQTTSLPGDLTLAEAGIAPGERIELVAPGASPPPPPQSRSLPPPERTRRSRGLVFAGALVAIALFAGAAFSATRLLDDSSEGSAEPVSIDWGSGVGATGPDEDSGSDDPAPVDDGPTTEPGEGEIPELTRDELRAEIGDLLLAHHTAIVAGDYQEAWELLSSRKRRQYLAEGSGYPTWRKNQSTLAAYLGPAGLQVSILAIDRPEGVVAVRLSGMGWSAPGSPCGEWSGITWVKYEDGGWYYDPGYSTTQSREQAWKSKYAKLLGGSC